jgi:hypothetical protein
MRRRLTLSKETLRTLDERELSLVVGGSGSDSDHDHHHHGHGKTGNSHVCNADHHKSHGSSCSNG